SYYTDDNDAEVVKARRSDLQLEPFDSPLLITKTDAELQILAQSGRSLIITKASEATCASWISNLLPVTSEQMPMICRNSQFLHPLSIPSSEESMPEAPWSRMKPDSVWFDTPLLLSRPAWKALKSAFPDSNVRKRDFATIALNAEKKRSEGCLETAQLQAVAAAMGDDQQINLAELAQHFSIFDPRAIQLWRLMKTDSDQFEAWQLDLGGKIRFSAVDEIKRFIIVWNTLISNSAGPVRRSLEADLEEIAEQTKKRKTKANKTMSARKRHKKPSVNLRNCNGRLIAGRGAQPKGTTAFRTCSRNAFKD
ncbi:MAG: hypothetical protein M1835_003273, partial [Candelina submexicana]